MPFTFRRSDIPRLDVDVDRGSSFKAWLEEWSAYHAVSGLSEESDDIQYHVLRLAFSRETATVIDNLGLPEEDRRKVNKIIDALKSHMKGAINETVERRNFQKRQQFARESFDDFLVALRDLVTTCNYCTDACTDNALRDQIIEGLLDGDTVEELLRQKDLTLSKTIQVCRAHEAAKQQRLEITGNSPEIGVTSAYKAKRQQRQPPKQNPLQRNTLRNCGRCGKPRHKELN